ncbi:MAG: glycosyltransferase [Desulfarculus sp.]|nr:glycosyltransferase [Desulfarculus sp.]
MHVAYLYPEHLGRPAARLLQVAATLRALTRQGAKVSLLVGRFAGLHGRLAELDLGPRPGLSLEPLAMWQPGPGSRAFFSWHLPYHLAALARLRRLAGQGLTWVLVRHLKLAGFLLPRLPELGLKLLFEAHELFSQTAREEGADPARVAALAALEARVFTGAHCLAAISRPLAQALEALPGVRGPVVVAPSGVEEEFFASGGQEREPGLVAYAGGLGAWKGVDLLFRAVASVPQARLEVLGGRPGSGDWQRLGDLAQGLGLEARLTMRPQAGQEAVRELLGRAVVAVWPGSGRQRIAAEFTSPLKLFEYLAAGCAVLAPDLPAARAVLAQGHNARLFRPDDADSLAQALSGLLAAPLEAGRLAWAGQRLARAYTWDARARVLLDAMGEGRP